MTLRVLFAFLFALTSAGVAWAGGADSLKLAVCQANFDRFAAAYPQERVYLHFDNTSYYKGERIWYKAYVVGGSDFRAAPLSRILYVELLNPMGYPVETQKLPLRGGQADGSFELSDTINAGFYEVRAYTAWMLNFTPGDSHGWSRLRSRDSRIHYGERFQRYLNGNAGVFSRVFPIYEPVDSCRYSVRRMLRQPKATSALARTAGDGLQVNFYPEGGNFVSGVPTRIAFQARTEAGRTLNVAGALMRGGDSIGCFKTDYVGRGMFSATADADSADLLVSGLELKLAYGGRDYRFPLPKARRRGYSLAVFPSAKGLRISVARNARTEGMVLGLSVTCRGQTGYAGVVDLRSSLGTVLSVDTALLRTGVNVVTLYTSAGRVVAQRMAFVNKHDMAGCRLRVAVRGDSAGVLPYAPVTLDCTVAPVGGRGLPDSLTFSLAVTDADSREATYDTGNVLTYLLLSSEIKGFVPHPAYYFEADDAEHRSALDLLMMVQGWTRYDFELMMSGDSLCPMPMAERSLVFRGRVLDDGGWRDRTLWKPVGGKKLWVFSEMVLSPDSIFGGECRVGSDGVFTLSFPPFFGSGRLSLALNRDSTGGDKGDIAGHNYPKRRNRRPGHLLGRHVEPLNQWSPLPKDYGYYETAALADPWDENIFGRAFMATTGRPGKYVAYDSLSGSYVMAGIDKVRRRRWTNFLDARPVCVADIDGLMAWLSGIFGDIQPFRWNQYRGLGGLECRSVNSNSFSAPFYSGLYELLYIFGLDGTHRAFVNGLSPDRGYRAVVGSAGNLPEGYRFFPHDENFRLLRIYADNDNRRLAYSPGRFGERVSAYRRIRLPEHGSSMPKENDHPVTSIFDFITDGRYADGSSLPEFMGYRINFAGFNRPVEFYCPDYSHAPLPEHTDCRRTVYWNPNVVVGRDRRATLHFHNNGFSRRLAVSAEGITPAGTMVVGE